MGAGMRSVSAHVYGNENGCKKYSPFPDAGLDGKGDIELFQQKCDLYQKQT